MSWPQIGVVIRVAEEKALLGAAYVCGAAVDLDVIVAALALDPLRGSPFADAPRWVTERTARQRAILATVIADRATPAVLTGKLPERSVGIANLSAHAVRRVVSAPAVAAGVALADGLRRLHGVRSGHTARRGALRKQREKATIVRCVCQVDVAALSSWQS